MKIPFFNKKKETPPPQPQEQTIHDKLKAWTEGFGLGYGYYNPVFPSTFDGEQNEGELGPIRQYFLDYNRLKLRSRQLFIESEMAGTILKKYARWVVGSKLSLKSEPKLDVLGLANTDKEKLNRTIESMWKVYADSKLSDISGKKTLHELCNEALMEKKIGGDMLVLLSVVNGTVKVRHIDGIWVGNPTTGIGYNGVDMIADNGNRIRWGVEIDKNGRHVAYYVRYGVNNVFNYNRIECYSKATGMRVAYLITENKYTVDSERGMPLLTPVMETAKKLSRYLAAAVGGAEERQKIALFFEHEQFSTNEDPLAARKAKEAAGYSVLNAASNSAPTIEGERLADKVAATTGKTSINLPNGVSIKAIASNQEMHVKEFTDVVIEVICATVGIPPNVAMDKYNDSFSASRMAGKSWEKTFMDERTIFTSQYLQPIYALQLYCWVLANRIQIEGYLEAVNSRDEFALEAYNYCRFVGDKFPDIDPMKEAKALRELTGPTMAHIPFITAEHAIEASEGGEFESVIRQSSEELKFADANGIAQPAPETKANMNF